MYGVYVHVPWCRYRCPYCAFAIDTRVRADDAAWLAGVLKDWEREHPFFEGRSSTLSFGGGTPSRADPAALAAVVRAVRPTGEVSLEANPEDVDAARVASWREAGIDRVSLGVQTFRPEVARRLGRAHSARQARSALRLLASGGFRSLSVDLIFGLAGVSLPALLDDLREAVEGGVHHVSLYGLTIEPGTVFSARSVTPVEGDAWAEMYDAAVDTLGVLGLQRYEVSNFAREGHRSAHNEHYWRARPWAGLGPAAHGWRPDGSRVANAEGFGDWSIGASARVDWPEPRDLLWELVWSTLRHVDGVDRAAVRRRCGILPRAPAVLVKNSILLEDEATIRLSPDGFAISDRLANAVVDASATVGISGQLRSADCANLRGGGDGDGAG